MANVCYTLVKGYQEEEEKKKEKRKSLLLKKRYTIYCKDNV